MELKKTVCYEDFGAVGDGITDDQNAIRATHEYANENKVDVVCNASKTYYIGAMAKAIPILTNVNWGNSTFIVDDRDIAPDYKIGEVLARIVCSFYLPSPGKMEIAGLDGLIERINASGGIKADECKTLDFDFGEPVLLRVFNDEHRNYIRYGVNSNEGSIQQETVVVEKDGTLDKNTPFMFDYEKITRIDVYKIDVEPLVVEGGTFITYPYLTDTPQDYSIYERGIYCARSNVTFRNIKHYIEKEGEYNYDENKGDYGCPYDGFYYSGLCNNILYENCVMSAHVAYMGKNGAGMGTYDVMARGSINITYKNCVQEDDNFFNKIGPSWRWGVMGSSGNKGIAYIGSKLTRFDAHGGVHNPSLIDSHIKMIRLNGTGTFLIENSTYYGKLLVSLREDYGGSWRGDVVLKNLTMETYGEEAILFYNRWYNHDFGFKIYMPENIVIDNLKLSGDVNKVNIFDPILLKQLEKACKDEIDGKPNINKIVPPKKIIIRNNTQGLEFVKPEGEFFENTEIIEE